ncbi:MAG: hypothetical protein ACE5I1_17970 [bacterium]
MIEQLNWQMAFLKQARADWDAYNRTRDTAWATCHRLYYLQMTTEKLGKALLIAGHAKLEMITQSHTAFVKFMRIVSNNRKLQEVLGMKKSQLRARFKRLLPLAYEIEILAPALAQSGPNPEYPWKDTSGRILAPVDYSFPLLKQLQNPQPLPRCYRTL